MPRVQIPIYVFNSTTGVPVSGATVTVTDRGTGNAASVFPSEVGGSAGTNILTTDSTGRTPNKWVERGAYNLQVSGTGITTYTQPWDAAAAGDATVDTSWIAPDAVRTADILDANVTTPKIADGAVTLAKSQIVPHALVTRTTVQAVASATDTTVALTSTTTDTGVASGYTSMVDGNGSVFARVGGLYLIEGAIHFEDPAGTSIGRRQLRLRRTRSGTTVTLQTDVWGATTNDFDSFRLSVSAVITAQAGDQFFLVANHTQTASLDILASTDTHSPRLSITYLGRLT